MPRLSVSSFHDVFQMSWHGGCLSSSELCCLLSQKSSHGLCCCCCLSTDLSLINTPRNKHLARISCSITRPELAIQSEHEWLVTAAREICQLCDARSGWVCCVSSARGRARDVVTGIIAGRPLCWVWKGTPGVRVLARETALVVCCGMERGTGSSEQQNSLYLRRIFP